MKLPSIRPYAAIVIGVDPGAQGGASIWDCGHYVTSRVVTCSLDRVLVLRRVHALASSIPTGIPVVMVFETWTAHGKINTDTLIGLGAEIGKWQERAEDFRVTCRHWQGPKSVKVKVNTWRKAVIGGTAYRNWPTDVWKRAAIQRATALTGTEPSTADEAEAILVGYWGTRAAEVGAVLPKATREMAA